jgi:pilus assembly protein TadC
MNRAYQYISESWRIFADWVAAITAAGAAMGLINMFVGLMSGIWLATQIYMAWRYKIPILKRSSQKNITEDE